MILRPVEVNLGVNLGQCYYFSTKSNSTEKHCKTDTQVILTNTFRFCHALLMHSPVYARTMVLKTLLT